MVELHLLSLQSQARNRVPEPCHPQHYLMQLGGEEACLEDAVESQHLERRTCDVLAHMHAGMESPRRVRLR